MRHTTISPLMIIHFAAPLGSGIGNYGESSRCILCQNRQFTENTIGQFLICRICTSLSCNTSPVDLISFKSDSPLFFLLFPTFSFRENKSRSLSLYVKRVTEERHTGRKGREKLVEQNFTCLSFPLLVCGIIMRGWRREGRRRREEGSHLGDHHPSSLRGKKRRTHV